MYFVLIQRTPGSIAFWACITIFLLLSTIITSFIHYKMHDKNEILRLRPKKYIFISLVSVFICLFCTSLKKFAYFISYDIFYNVIMLTCTSFFYLYFLDATYFFSDKSKNHQKLSMFFIKDRKQLRKYLIFFFLLCNVLSTFEIIIVYYTENQFYNVVYIIEYVIFMAVFGLLYKALSKQEEDSVGFKFQIQMLGIVTIIFPFWHIYVIAYKIHVNDITFMISTACHYEILAFAHILGFIQLGYPIIFVLRDNAVISRSRNSSRESKFDSLIEDEIFLDHFGDYLKSEFSLLHLNFYKDSEMLVNLIERKLLDDTTSETDMSALLDKMIHILDVYVKEEEEEQNHLKSMFEGDTGELETINIEYSMRKTLNELRYQLTKPSFLDVFDVEKENKCLEDFKGVLVTARKKVFRMLRNSYSRFKRKPTFAKYINEYEECRE